jgi:hypothetical protein
MRSEIPFSLWTGILVITLVCESLSALTIYRFGGDDAPPPEKLASPDDVEFIHTLWTDPFSNLNDIAIRSRRHNPRKNIALTAPDRGGGVREGTRQDDLEKAVDGDMRTAWLAPGFLISSGTRQHGLTFGLGGFFTLDRVRVISGIDDASGIARNFRISAASGRTADVKYGVASTGQVYNLIADVRDNKRQIIDVRIPPAGRVDFVSISVSVAQRQETAIHEIEIYAKPSVERSSYISDIIDLERPFAWGELSWGGWQQRGAEVLIHTRSGKSLEQDIYWRHTGRGNKVPLTGENTARQYQRLALGERAGTSYNLDKWSFWSAPYDFADSSGTPVVSAGPRRFFQFKVDIIPFGEAGGEVKFLEFRASQPLASGLIGEVFPNQSQTAESSPFTYYLKPAITGDATGFNGLEMTSTSIINGVAALRIGESDVPLDLDADVTPLDAEGRPVADFPANGFQLNFGGRRLRAADSGTPVEVDFDARVLRSGATFDVRVLDTEQPLAVRQKVEAGNANNLIEGDRVAVITTVAAESLLQATVTKVVTPNDDGSNDVASISYDILEIIGASHVAIEISDLSGRVVAQVYSGRDAIGHYEREWRGLDDGGDLVPPGAYLYRIEVDTDRSEKVTQIGVVNVAF